MWCYHLEILQLQCYSKTPPFLKHVNLLSWSKFPWTTLLQTKCPTPRSQSALFLRCHTTLSPTHPPTPHCVASISLSFADEASQISHDAPRSPPPSQMRRFSFTFLLQSLDPDVFRYICLLAVLIDLKPWDKNWKINVLPMFSTSQILHFFPQTNFGPTFSQPINCG